VFDLRPSQININQIQSLKDNTVFDMILNENTFQFYIKWCNKFRYSWISPCASTVYYKVSFFFNSWI